MKMLKNFAAVISAAALAVCLASCDNANYTKAGGEITTADVNALATVTEISEAKEFGGEEDSPRTIMDREGNLIQVRENVNTIISAAPSVTEILTGLDIGDKIIAADMYSSGIEGISSDICTLDFSNLNVEEIIALSPDLIIVSGMSVYGGDDPYAALKDAGVNVIYVPISNSISGIKLDIEFIASYLDAEKQGAKLMEEIDTAVRDVSEKVASLDVGSSVSVYFEIGAAPYFYTCGSGTFIDEMITLAGGKNIYGEENGWISNSEESVIAANPDIIITNVAYDGYDYNEIKSRAGWENITAVKNNAVYAVDANATSRPSQHIAEGIYEIAKAIHPELYTE